jgi:hypothetical protein
MYILEVSTAQQLEGVGGVGGSLQKFPSALISPDVASWS